jgi:alpha-ribazole phosphatase
MTHAPSIDLLRHGETEAGSRYCGTTDTPLTTAGWEQMWTAIGHEARWQMIVSSPLKRCVEFARTLAQRHALALRTDDRLREMHFGAWEGRTAAELMQTDADALGRFWGDPSRHSPTGGESLASLQTRVLAAWHEIVSERRAILVITHGGPIRIILSYLRCVPVDRSLEIDVPLASRWRTKIALDAQIALERR